MSIKLVIFETNQRHVGGVLADEQEINKSSFEIFVCILLTSNHMIFLVQFGINKHFENFKRPQIALALRARAILLVF